MYLSKHNYAIELARSGHTVYFLNPPTYVKSLESISLSVKQEKPNLYLVDYNLSLAIHHLRFKARIAFDLFIRKSLIRQLNKLANFNELWCFEPNIFSSFQPFNAKKKLLFIVDQHDNKTIKKLAGEADGIATISSLILEYFEFSTTPKLLLNHGLNRTFTELAKTRLAKGISDFKQKGPVKLAYVGNLLQGNRMDHKTLQEIVQQNPKVQFHIYGPYEVKGNTLGSNVNESLQQFIQALKNATNVKLHGILPQDELAKQMQEADAFLTCYNYLTDDNKSSNCHKIIEYLSTGKTVISNRIITYENTTGLMEMPAEYTNENLPALFKEVTSRLPEFNAPDKQKIRIDFALQNTYQHHIKTISSFLGEPAASLATEYA